MAAALTSEKQGANVPHPEIYGKVNGSANLSCESQGQPLTLCVWKRIGGNEQRDILIVDQEVFKNARGTFVQGTSSVSDGLQNGTCNLNITSLMNNDFGRWSCALVAQTGNTFGGKLSVVDG